MYPSFLALSRWKKDGMEVNIHYDQVSLTIVIAGFSVSMILSLYEPVGTKAKLPGAGGDGGKGGFGGTGGKIFLFGVEQNPAFVISNRAGNKRISNFLSRVVQF